MFITINMYYIFAQNAIRHHNIKKDQNLISATNLISMPMSLIYETLISISKARKYHKLAQLELAKKNLMKHSKGIN